MVTIFRRPLDHARDNESKEESEPKHLIKQSSMALVSYLCAVRASASKYLESGINSTVGQRVKKTAMQEDVPSFAFLNTTSIPSTVGPMIRDAFLTALRNKLSQLTLISKNETNTRSWFFPLQAQALYTSSFAHLNAPGASWNN